MSADNQQERLSNNWISGFVDGEGCFHVAINKLEKMTIGWQVLPEFRIVQHERDIQILERIRNHLNVGVIRKNHDNRYELRVRSLDDLNTIVVFFEQFPLFTKKRFDFDIFKKIIILMNQKRHLSEEGVRDIANLAAKMNRRIKSRYLESSETIRQASARISG